jgi:LuxR family transcriptional regulator, maltose regulon positive regulatory protein
MHLVVLSAPPGSGKAEVLDEVRSLQSGVMCAPEILDDFDTLDSATREDCLRALEGGGRHMILASTRPEPFDLSRLRLSGQCRLFGLEDLALSPEALSAWSAGVLGTASNDRAVRTLMARTAGWRGAWRIIIEAVDAGQSVEEIARTFSGAHPHLVAYFRAQVLAHLPEATTAALLDASVAEELNVDLVNAITEQRHALEHLEEASRRTGFVSRTDASRRFHAHPLLMDFLRHEAERRDPDRLAELQERAAVYFAGRGDLLSAARCWSAAGQHERAVAIITERADELVTGRGEVRRYREITRTMPTALRDRIATEVALGAAFSGDFAMASAALEDARKRLCSSDVRQARRLDAVSVVTNYGLENFEEVRSEGLDWLRAHSDTEPRYRALVAGSLFFACFAELDVQGAAAALAFLRAARQPRESPFLAGWSAVLGALQALDTGSLREAEQVLMQAPHADAIAPSIGCMRASIELERGHLARAEQLLNHNFDAVLKHSTVETALVAWETAIQLAFLDQGLTAGLDVAHRAAERIAISHGERGRRTISLVQAVLLLRSTEPQDPDAVAREIASISNNIELFAAGHRLRERARLLHARHQVLDGDAQHGVRMLQPLINDAERTGRTPTWVQASFLKAHGLFRSGQSDRATRVAWSALERAAERDLRTCVIAEARLLAPMLDDLAQRAMLGTTDTERTARELLEGIARQTGRLELSCEPPEANQNLDVHLTEAELSILVLAAAGHSNAEIAERRFTQVSTIKWHMQNILRKLDVKSRVAAIAAARRLGRLG